MVLDREEEAKRMMMGGGQAAYGQGAGGYEPYAGAGGFDANDMRQAISQAPDMTDIQPKQRKMAGGKQKQ